ncbi:type II secretion system protein [Mucisphaera sp.]|uniref:type II secretion system protein n=1 Tax=Mucisphaera sp. TaxID=2913024 RepID=UPI003D10D8F2
MNHHIQRQAFTLIELLVVISIIALLIGILLPALGAARRTAQDVACLSNQRQLGIAFFGYATEHKGFNPPSFVSAVVASQPANGLSSYGPSGTEWSLLLQSYISGGGGTNYTSAGATGTGEETVDAFICPATGFDTGRIQYSAHPLTVPVWNTQQDFDEIKAYNLERVVRTTEVMLIADGRILANPINAAGVRFEGLAWATLTALDDYDVYNNRRYYDSSDADNSDTINEGLNTDSVKRLPPDNFGDLRWRHAGGGDSGSERGSVNVLWSDGRASSQVRGSLLNKHVRPDTQ